MRYRGRRTVVGQVAFTISLLYILLASVGASPTSQETQLSDSEAKQLIEQQWNSDGDFRVYLGDFQVVRERPDLTRRRMALSEFDSYKAWQDLGLIRIILRKDLSEKFTGWNDWNRLFAEDIQLDVQIQPTQEGASLQVEQKGDVPSFLRIPSGSTIIEKIVQNEPLKIGADEYRVVLGLHTTNRTQEVRYYLHKINAPTATEGKFKALLKFDPFSSTWRIIAQDTADRVGEFATDNVNLFIKRQQ